MTGRLAGKTAIITGASSGIGRATALLFAREGASVVCSDLRPDTLCVTTGEVLVPTHETVITSGAKAIYVKCDVKNASEVEALVKKSVEEYGRLDIMVNNAGIGLPKSVPVWEVEEATWDLQQEVNSKSVFLGCKYASKQMISQEPGPSGDRGWIVNTASIVGLVGFAGSLPYCASKHAVAGITKTAALDCAPHRVHVNAVCPGWAHTGLTEPLFAKVDGLAQGIGAMHPFRGLGQPEDIARAVLFLASEDNSWMTGAIMPVDGGYTAQ
ncbi:hypothetical protein BLS_002876 [Venturia inaequalis]|uniref:NAD(P)-binding protein n=1 Tax=Venturia inaequalis TaxID=5025 RepID=A0A8H3Z958_VENIN|nr:hypothetical protein EG328_004491 [Venturia inaequalis]KAE9974875.1 hypothetical protein BLS_002876 [Venturia inaequalis]KAE9990204.1 hypothetical protein EG327_001716 [Venturia inaequalis]